ncbi:Uncharacterised protein [Campylobacter ureolyticus]|uniref:Uncharacterized protein n=1 Tax=Campylobacter ureolyticus TaxID=827 RepID=A0A6N2U6C9_9BACT
MGKFGEGGKDEKYTYIFLIIYNKEKFLIYFNAFGLLFESYNFYAISKI